MSISAEAVKQLRERTGAGMMECKKALVETQGDLDAAAELMRKQGLAKADKKAARVAAEGVIALEKSADGKSAVMAEINCETDFVAREADFQSFSSEVAKVALAASSACKACTAENSWCSPKCAQSLPNCVTQRTMALQCSGDKRSRNDEAACCKARKL